MNDAGPVEVAFDGVCALHRGRIPLLVSLPHDGSDIPADLRGRMTRERRTAATIVNVAPSAIKKRLKYVASD